MMRRNLWVKLSRALLVVILTALPLMNRAQTGAPRVGQPAAPSAAQADPYADAFAGLNYTDEQKEAVTKIREDSAMRKAAVLKDDKLSADQKDAMLTGYTRLEYGAIFKQLTPEQRKEISAKLRARRAADQASKKKPAVRTK